MKKNIEKYESGRSMVEMVGVLAIAGLITAGAFVLIRAGLASQKRSRAADEVATIVASVRSLSAEREDFANLPPIKDFKCDKNETAALAAAMLGGQGLVATPLDRESCYHVGTVGDANSFVVALVNIPDNDCTVLASRAWAESQSVKCEKEKGLLITYGKD